MKSHEIAKNEDLEINTEDIELIIDTLHQDIKNVFDTASIKSEFDSMLNSLKEKEEQLRETITKLEKTENTLKKEMLKRKEEEQQIKQELENLEDEQDRIQERIAKCKKEAENLVAEQEKLSNLMNRMKSILIDFKGKIQEYHSS